MADCTNVEIRELLPERAGGALSAADIARVDAHLASCALCSAELALISAARRSLRVAPSIDVARVSAAVVAATAAPSRPQLVAGTSSRAAVRAVPRLRWIGWKAAAAITIAAAGIGSFAVWRSADDSTAPNAAPNAVAAAELGVGGGLGDLSSGDLKALLGDLGPSGAGIATADASFEDPEVIVPEVGDVNEWESL